ncbi:MAG: helix-turn-helix transcriptional regulator [Lactobacillus sp.]|uniref:helix-turn-helix domain-containing protein n=1 Tax=Bombilactobacillus bombi TaxID=1303590 RepID=UPI0035EEDE04|nr:helix-turn-helix transcriptional regulator [Lactobacillus sp.]
MNNDAQLITQRLIDYLQKRNLTINRIATLSNLSQSTINNLFDGSTKSPTISTVRAICYGLNISVTEFFDFPPYNEVER